MANVAKGMKEYEVDMDGWVMTVQLTDDAARESPGVRLVGSKAKQPANKSATAENK